MAAASTTAQALPMSPLMRERRRRFTDVVVVVSLMYGFLMQEMPTGEAA